MLVERLWFSVDDDEELKVRQTALFNKLLQNPDVQCELELLSQDANRVLQSESAPNWTNLLSGIERIWVESLYTQDLLAVDNRETACVLSKLLKFAIPPFTAPNQKVTAYRFIASLDLPQMLDAMQEALETEYTETDYDYSFDISITKDDTKKSAQFKVWRHFHSALFLVPYDKVKSVEQIKVSMLQLIREFNINTVVLNDFFDVADKKDWNYIWLKQEAENLQHFLLENNVSLVTITPKESDKASKTNCYRHKAIIEI